MDSGMCVDSDKCIFDCAFFRDFDCEAGVSSEGLLSRLFTARSFWISTLSSPLFVQNIVAYGYALVLKAFPASAFIIVLPLSIQILLKKLSKNCYITLY